MMITNREWMRKVWRPATALALVTGLAAPILPASDVSAQDELPSAAAAAPESTVLFHTLDLDREGDQWQLTEELLGRVGLPGALDMGEEAVLEEGEATGDLTSADLDALLGGELAIVVMPQAVKRLAQRYAAHHAGDAAMESAEATPEGRTRATGQGVAAILVASDPDAAWSYATGQLNDLAAETGADLEESTYGDADLITVSKRGSETPATTDSADPMEEWLAEFDVKDRGSLVAAYAGDYIIVAPHQADVRSIVDVIDGNEPSLADSEAAAAVADELPEEALSYTYIDGQGIIDALGPELTSMLQSYAPELPQDAWGAQVGITISADEPGFRFDTITIPTSEAAAEAMVLPNDPEVMTAAERVPSGSFAFQAGNLPETAYASAPFLLAQLVNGAVSGDPEASNQAMMTMPTPEEMEAEIAKATAILGFDPAADLFDLLGFEFIAFSSFPSFTMDSFDLDAAAAVSTTDPDALAETVDKIATLIESSAGGEVTLTPRTVDGGTVYVISAPDTEGVPAIEFGVADDQFIFSIGDGLAQLATEPDRSLADDEQFQTVMHELPSEYNQIGYLDIGQAIDTVGMLIGMMGGMEMPVAATPTAGANGPENIRALGAVEFETDGMTGSSAILYIAEP